MPDAGGTRRRKEGGGENHEADGEPPVEIDQDVLDEGSYYLSKLDLDPAAIAQRFEIPKGDVLRHKTRYERKLKRGDALETAGDLAFWMSVKQEAEGNIKVTFLSEKGFHHAWRTDLEKLDTATLFEIFESCKRFLNLDPNARFLEYSPPKNYDPLAMQREVSKAVTVVSAILEGRSKGPPRPKDGRG